MIDTDCTTCDGVGTLGCDPETNERIYCDACVYGVELHRLALANRTFDDAMWLSKNVNDRDRLGDDYAAVCIHLNEGLALYDGLGVKLDAFDQDEVGRVRALLFEDL